MKKRDHTEKILTNTKCWGKGLLKEYRKLKMLHFQNVPALQMPAQQLAFLAVELPYAENNTRLAIPLGHTAIGTFGGNCLHMPLA